jgi:dTDP-4-amino-4,6-dideoxygalactose transaminase
MDLKNKSLAINGGNPVTKDFIIIHKPSLEEDDIAIVSEAVRSTFVSGDGPKCRDFEKMLADYLSAKHVFFTTSCTSALDLAFMIKQFPAESEVIVPNFTYTSTALAPILNNLKVVLVDVDPGTGNIDINKIEDAITGKTVAICPVDYAGNPADMDEINRIAKKHGLYVVHDTAQSIGATYKKKKTGTLADVSCFSFHGTKNITTGEGGALVTDNDEIAEKVKIARDKGTDKFSFISNPEKKGFYEYVNLGNSYVQSNILGALGISQLKKLDRLNQRRKEIAEFYYEELSGMKEIALPPLEENKTRNWHIFYLLVKPDYRLWMIDALKAEGIGSNVHYNPLHLNRYYEALGEGKDLRNSEKFYRTLVRIPVYPALTNKETKKIVQAVKKVLGY